MQGAKANWPSAVLKKNEVRENRDGTISYQDMPSEYCEDIQKV